MKNKVVNSIIFGIFILVIIALTIYLFPLVISLKDEGARIALQTKIDNLGFWGYLAVIGIQTAQVVIAFLPGEPVEIILGFMYGPFWGTIICLTGIIIGTLIIYVLAKVIGKPFLSLFINPDKLNDYKFLNSKAKKDSIVFTLFFIPGTPKDILTYFVPFIKMNPFRFIIISLFARIPSILTSTISGASISKGKFGLAIIMFFSTLVIALIGYFINQKYMKKHNKNKEVIVENIDA